MTLDLLKENETGIIHSIEDEALALQLLSMGFLIGEQLKVERIAPFNDPMIIKSKNNCISIRKKDAKKIKLQTN